MKPKLYFAGPLGFSEAGRHFMYNVLTPLIEQEGFVVLDPWKLTDQYLIDEVMQLSEGIERANGWRKINPIIGANNEKGIIDAQVVLAVLDGVDVDSGTAAEIGFAAALEKPVIGYRGDFRLSADNEGSKVNLQVEYWIQKHGGSISCSLEELKPLLRAFHRQFVT